MGDQDDCEGVAADGVAAAERLSQQVSSLTAALAAVEQSNETLSHVQAAEATHEGRLHALERQAMREEERERRLRAYRWAAAIATLVVFALIAMFLVLRQHDVEAFRADVEVGCRTRNANVLAQRDLLRELARRHPADAAVYRSAADRMRLLDCSVYR